MEFKKIPNNDYTIRKIKMKTNAELAHNLIEPLNSITCGSLILINGGPNSGKTNLLINLLSNRNKNGKKQSFKNCFHNIFLCSPTLHTIDDNENIFKDLDDEYVFDEFNDDFLDFYFASIEEQKDDSDNDDYEEPVKNLIVLDDVADALKNKSTLKKFNNLCIKRRHYNTTVIVISQAFKMMPITCRKSASHIIAFQPQDVNEEELIFDYFKLKKKHMNDTFKYFFQKPHDYIFIDRSKGGIPKFYSRFDRVLMNEIVK
jgi:hypothetical protein